MPSELRIPVFLGDIQPGDRVNTFHRMHGKVCISSGRLVESVVREYGRILWIIAGCAPILPEDITYVWRNGPADRQANRA
jgi:hypothetical protein